ncbi:hypothetical protein [Vibrio crassostreae]|uniref:hypothetical protein n=1 Tax=Vibrio crassostreae TaxID=246167 RepID=UPI001B31693D|nr:hypothetical protein [Vibrio crassostreae]
MILFRIFLAILWLALSVYTAVVVSNYGMGLLPIFFGDILAMTWPGQFNLDFMFMLALSALWVGWRHQFSAGGLALVFLAFIGGASFLTVYLLVLSYQAEGDMKKVLLGSHA